MTEEEKEIKYFKWRETVLSIKGFTTIVITYNEDEKTIIEPRIYFKWFRDNMLNDREKLINQSIVAIAWTFPNKPNSPISYLLIKIPENIYIELTLLNMLDTSSNRHQSTVNLRAEIERS
jgi:hypothetical protein